MSGKHGGQVVALEDVLDGAGLRYRVAAADVEGVLFKGVGIYRVTILCGYNLPLTWIW